MENIKLVDMHEAKNEANFSNVKGGDGYIKFDGVDGETKDRDHKRWSDLASFSQG